MSDDTTQATPPLPWRVYPDDRPEPSRGMYMIKAADDEIVCSISPREVGQIIVDAVNSRAIRDEIIAEIKERIDRAHKDAVKRAAAMPSLYGAGYDLGGVVALSHLLGWIQAGGDVNAG